MTSPAGDRLEPPAVHLGEKSTYKQNGAKGILPWSQGHPCWAQRWKGGLSLRDSYCCYIICDFLHVRREQTCWHKTNWVSSSAPTKWKVSSDGCFTEASVYHYLTGCNYQDHTFSFSLCHGRAAPLKVSLQNKLFHTAFLTL